MLTRAFPPARRFPGAGVDALTLYTFFLCRDDGSAHAFEAHEMRDDAAALALAAAILADHASAAYVNVYDGDRQVLASQPAAEEAREGCRAN